MTFHIVTDSTSDLSLDWVKENDVTVLGLTIQLDGQTYETVGETALTSNTLLAKMAAGSQPTTSQVNVGQFEEVFRAAAQEGRNVLYLGLSASLSGTYQSAFMAKEMVCEDFPNAVIEVVDTKTATIGEGYLVMKAVEARAAGKTATEARELVEELIPHVHIYLMVDDLNHLVRGGRLSKAAAMIGGLVNIKPILSLNAEGSLVPTAKVRGKKKALKEMIALSQTKADEHPLMVVYTGEDSVTEDLRSGLSAQWPESEMLLAPLGPVLATHTGLGTLAIVFISQNKRS